MTDAATGGGGIVVIDISVAGVIFVIVGIVVGLLGKQVKNIMYLSFRAEQMGEY